MSDTEPDIFSYLDHRAYLRDWLSARRARTFATFARRVGCARSYVSNVVNGKRPLTVDMAEQFCDKALRLDGRARQYFLLLVRYNQAALEVERSSLLSRLIEMRPISGIALEKQFLGYISNWYYQAIYELARCEDFRSDPEWIAAQIRPTITAEQALEALQAMVGLGMMSVREGLFFVQEQSEEQVGTSYEMGVDQAEMRLAVLKHYQWAIGRGQQALEEFPSEQRQYGSITTAVPAAALPHIKEEITRFQRRIIELCNGQLQREYGQNSSVVQLNIQFFPLSQLEVIEDK